MADSKQVLEWRWWAGRNEDEYRLAGPCKCREQAIDDAYGDTEPGDTIFLIEAVAGEWNDFDGLFEFTHFRNRSSVIREEDKPIKPALRAIASNDGGGND